MTDTTDTRDVSQRLLESERVSIKAVWVDAGQDPAPLLREAGITEALALPAALNADSGTAAALGDGWGSSVTATWEPDQDEEGDSPATETQDTASDHSTSNADAGTPPMPPISPKRLECGRWHRSIGPAEVALL